MRSAISKPAEHDPESRSGRLLIDVTRTLDSGLHTGIQRVVRGLLSGARAAAATGALGPEVRAVRCEGDAWFVLNDLPPHQLEIDAGQRKPLLIQPGRILDAGPGDVLLLADASWYCDPWPAVGRFRAAGGQVAGFVHDLLPALRPEWFRPRTSALFTEHLQQLLLAAESLFVSTEHVAGQLRAHGAAPQNVHRLPLASSLMPAERAGPHAAMAIEQPFFLCVATLEPRKNHALVLDAFDRLWSGGSGHQLVLVGSEGWRSEALRQRLATHPQAGRRLHWLQGVNDATLSDLYARAEALIYVPRDEGFGLPVVEAKRFACPVLASDIPPLREAGGNWPRFVAPLTAAALAEAIAQTSRAHAAPAQYTVRDWQDVGQELLAALFPEERGHRAHGGMGH